MRALGEGGLVTAVTAAEMRAIDQGTIEAGTPGLRLMERAGEAVVLVLRRELGAALRHGTLVVAGRGNNGGDGLVVARLLRRRRSKVEVVLVGERGALSPDAAANLRRLERAGGRVIALDRIGIDGFVARLRRAGVVVDALFGTGIRSPLDARSIAVIEAMNAAGAPVVAVDVPSGLDADRGVALESAVQATLTVTFAFPKVGLLVHPGVDLAGDVVVADIGIAAAAVDAVRPRHALLTGGFLPTRIPLRAPDSHKGTYGHLLVIGGSRGKIGAVAIAARAAFRSGAGLVTVAGASRDLGHVLAVTPEVMTAALPERGEEPLATKAPRAIEALLAGKSAVVVGPGLGTGEGAERVLRTVLAADLPVVVDADGLNLLAADVGSLRERDAPTVLTPHPGEMARLVGRSTEDVQVDRLALARVLAAESRTVVVLKGSRTIVASPHGDVAINPSGNPGMATGGMGDALAGILGSLLAQGLPPFDAAAAAVHWHGLAGDRVARRHGEAGILASDVIEELGPTLLAERDGERP
jgi:ADP-dependent NAD(P)H-hydrate dehydratase / NAD(P)H-hydrate epimerase